LSGAAYGVKEGDGLACGVALAAAVAGDEEALHARAERVRTLPHRLPVGEILALPPALDAAAARVRLGLAGGSHLVCRASRVGVGAETLEMAVGVRAR
jgi:hypothetical protein